MSQLIIDLTEPNPDVLKAAISMLQQLVGEDVPVPLYAPMTQHIESVIPEDEGVEPEPTVTAVPEGFVAHWATPVVEPEPEFDTSHIVVPPGSVNQVHLEQDPVAAFGEPEPQPQTQVVPPGVAFQQPAPDSVVRVETNPAPTINDLEVDNAGIPWDERIHSKNKTKLNDGTWRLKKGVTDQYRNQVINELMAGKDAGTAPPGLPAAEVTNTPDQDKNWQNLLQKIVLKVQAREINMNDFTARLEELGIHGGTSGLSLRPDVWSQIIQEYKL